MGRRRLTAAIGLFSIMAVAAACGERPEGAVPDQDIPPAEPAPDTPPPAEPGAQAELPPGVTPEMVAAGQEVFNGAGACFSCHGQDGSGTPLAPSLRDDTWLNISGRNYDEIVELVKTGVAEPVEAPALMPARGGTNISDEQVNQVAAYVMTLGS